jgi:hypothetical protein
MKHRWIYEAAIVLFAAAGCAAPGNLPGAGTAAPFARQQLGPATTSPEPGLKIAGTYSGSIKWQEGDKSFSGTLKATINVHGKDISGPFDVTRNGDTSHLSMSGKITSQTKKIAHLSYDINDTKGHYATGTATITTKTLSGKATVSGSKPVSIEFSAKIKKKHKK